MERKTEVLEFIKLIRDSFIGSEQVYTNGSCYQFYKLLKSKFSDALAYYNSDHVITKIGDLFYDITGIVDITNHLNMSEHYPDSKVKDCKFDIYSFHTPLPTTPKAEQGCPFDEKAFNPIIGGSFGGGEHKFPSNTFDAAERSGEAERIDDLACEFGDNYDYSRLLTNTGINSRAGVIEGFKAGFLAAKTERVDEWISVEDRLPEKDVPVMCYGLNSNGKGITLRAIYVPQYHMPDDGDFSGDADYNEEKDEYFWPQGWYEWNEYEDTHWLISHIVTEWTYLTKPPKK